MTTPDEGAKRECRWVQSEDFDCDYWDTACGEAFTLIDGTPKENTYNYCPACGGKIKEAKP